MESQRLISSKPTRRSYSCTSFFLTCIWLSVPLMSYAQEVTGALENVRDWIVGIANVVFVIVIVVGIIKTVTAFVQGSSHAVRSLVLLIIAALVWFGFSLIVEDFSQYGAIENI